jgi:hypothetical protein
LGAATNPENRDMTSDKAIRIDRNFLMYILLSENGLMENVPR